jgi:chorismate mutase
VSNLELLRKQLDAVDAELIHLLARRAGIVDEIWTWKGGQGLPRVDPHREAELRGRLLAQAEALGLSREAVGAILERIVGKQLLQK